MRGEIRGNDTVLEHFPQLALLLTTIFAGRTMTQLDPGLSLPARIFIDDNSYFLWASALISLLSICSGHMVFIVTLNGGFKTFKGILLKIPYFFVSVVARVFYIMLFLTPFLGLFDVSHHGIEGYKWHGPVPTGQVFEITGILGESCPMKTTTIPLNAYHSRKWDYHKIRRCVEEIALRQS